MQYLRGFVYSFESVSREMLKQILLRYARIEFLAKKLAGNDTVNKDGDYARCFGKNHCHCCNQEVHGV